MNERKYIYRNHLANHIQVSIKSVATNSTIGYQWHSLERRADGGTGRQPRAGNFTGWTAVGDPRSERGGEGRWPNPCRGAWPTSCRRQRDWDEWWAERLRDADLWDTA